MKLSNRYRSDSGDRRQYRQGRGRPRYEKIIGEVISEVMQGILTDRISGENIEIITGMKVMTEVQTGLEKGHFLETIVAIEIGVQAIAGPVQN